MSEPKSGWQQPRLPAPTPKCVHLGMVFANLAAYRQREGDQWVCPCGAVFAVVSNAGRDKRLVPEWRTPAPAGGGSE